MSGGPASRMSRANLERELLACRDQLRRRDRLHDETVRRLTVALEAADANAARERENADRFHALLIAERIKHIPDRGDPS